MKNESNLNCLLMIFQGLCKLHHHLKRLYDAPNQKEKSPLRNSQPISSSPLDDDKLFENIDDVLTDCFLYEEQDSFLLKLIKDQNLQGAIERLTKSYLISGKDIKVIFQLFKMQGRIDAILIENNEMGQIDMLKKAKGFMQIQSGSTDDMWRNKLQAGSIKYQVDNFQYNYRLFDTRPSLDKSN
eukprot:403336409